MHIETILLGVIQYPAPQGMGYELAGNLFDIKPTPGFQHPENFRQTGLPVRNVVEGAEIKDGIVGGIIYGDMPGIALPDIYVVIASVPA